MGETGTLFPLKIERIAKRFGSVRALSDVSFEIQKGSCVALLGENGAGKSTLMRILAGAIQPDQGRLVAGGRELKIPNARRAQQLGIHLCHQELQVVPRMSVRENLELGAEEVTFGFVGRGAALDRVMRELNELGFSGDADMPIGDLSVAERQLVLIAKGLREDTNLVILDEPTAALAPKEVGLVMKLVRRLVNSGKSVIYISHRLDEVSHVADRVLILRDGAIVGELPPTADHDEVVQKMVGREIGTLYPERKRPVGRPLLRLNNISAAGIADVSLEVREGEIVGVGGLVGAGQQPLAQAIYGRIPVRSGDISVDTISLKDHSITDAVRAGISYVGEDRRNDGLAISHSIEDNITLPALKRLNVGGFLKTRRLKSEAEVLAADLRVKCADLDQAVGQLSGGNQQKVVLARALITKPKILILIEPTRGVDVGARSDIYSLLDGLTAKGLGILLVTSDLSELLGISDRVVMLYRGRVSGNATRAEATAEHLGALATGQGVH